MKTKLAKLVLFGLLTVGLLAGCKDKEEPAPASSTDPAPSSETTSTSEDTSVESSDLTSSEESSESSESSSEEDVPEGFPYELVYDYFMDEITEMVELPDELELSSPQASWQVEDSMFGNGPRITAFPVSQEEGRGFMALFKETGWLKTAIIDDDDYLYNFLGMTQAYVEIWWTHNGITFDFFIDDIPDPDDIIDDDDQPTTHPFPTDQIQSIVYGPVGIAPQYPTLSSETATFSIVNVNPGAHTATISARDLTTDERTAFRAAFVTAGWILQENGKYNYGGATQAWLAITEVNATMTQYVFTVEDAPSTGD